MSLVIGDIEIDEASHRVRRGGESVAVEPRVFDLIVFLAKASPRVVSRAELLDEVWNGVVVGDAALSRAVREARRVLGDSGREQRLIQTVVGRGFRMSSAVQKGEPAPTNDKRSEPAPCHQSIFGRDRELAQLKTLAATVLLEGRVNLAEVCGPTGIGKTKLLEAFVASPGVIGMQIVWVSCIRSPGAPALWPWRQLWRELDARHGNALRDAVPPEHRECVASWVDGSPAISLDRAEQRFSLAQGLVAAVLRLTRRDPLLLVMDDAQDLDSGSREVLRLLEPKPGQSAPLFIVAAINTTSEPEEAEPSSRRWSQAWRIQLAGLDAVDVEAWLASESRDDDEDLAERGRQLRLLTGGNPLHVRHLLWSGLTGRQISESHAATLWAAVSTRLGSLSAIARRVLEALALMVTGDARILADAADIEVEAVLSAMDELSDGEWVCPAIDRPGEHAVSHAALAAVIRDNLDRAERRMLHDRVGRARWRRDDVERAAVHLVLGEAQTRAELGATAAEAAARAAFRKGAFNRAAEHAQAALEALRLRPATDSGEIDSMAQRERALMLLLASARGRDGDVRAAAALYRSLPPVAAASTGTSAGVTWTDRQRAVVQRLFGKLAPRLGALVDGTYRRLFNSYPEVRALFGRNRPEVQSKMLADTLTSIVDHLEDPPWLGEALERLGCTHVDYGVTEEMFTWLGDALCDSVADALGNVPDDEELEAFRAVYDVLVQRTLTVMRRAAAS